MSPSGRGQAQGGAAGAAAEQAQPGHAGQPAPPPQLGQLDAAAVSSMPRIFLDPLVASLSGRCQDALLQGIFPLQQDHDPMLLETAAARRVRPQSPSPAASRAESAVRCSACALQPAAPAEGMVAPSPAREGLGENVSDTPPGLTMLSMGRPPVR
jgi:hypothetical protein